MFFESRAVYEIMWKNIVQPGRPQTTMVHAHRMMDTYDYKHRIRMPSHLLLFHCNIGDMKASQYYITVHRLSCCY